MGEIKRALVLSGGGSKGAYQVGVLKALAEMGHKYDGYYGVSVGALNAAYLGMYYDFADGVKDLEQKWLSLETKRIYKKWFAWPLSIPFKPSIYNSTPLEKWVGEEIKEEKYIRPVSVGWTSLATGEYRSMNNEHPAFKKSVIASASFPGFFKPVEFRNEWLIDGGVRNVTPLKEAIDSGATEIDCVVLDAAGIEYSNKKPKTLNVLSRTINIMLDEIVENDIKMCQLYNKHNLGRKIKLTVYRPSSPLGVNSLDFNSEQNKKLMKWGYQETFELV